MSGCAGGAARAVDTVPGMPDMPDRATRQTTMAISVAVSLAVSLEVIRGVRVDTTSRPARCLDIRSFFRLPLMFELLLFQINASKRDGRESGDSGARTVTLFDFFCVVFLVSEYEAAR